jgi:hypothetical protein
MVVWEDLGFTAQLVRKNAGIIKGIKKRVKRLLIA